MIKLLGCPFCGEDPEIVRLGTQRVSCIIQCVWCGCRLETNERDEWCGDLWNKRIDLVKQEWYEVEEVEG